MRYLDELGAVMRGAVAMSGTGSKATADTRGDAATSVR